MSTGISELEFLITSTTNSLLPEVEHPLEKTKALLDTTRSYPLLDRITNFKGSKVDQKIAEKLKDNIRSVLEKMPDTIGLEEIAAHSHTREELQDIAKNTASNTFFDCLFTGIDCSQHPVVAQCFTVILSDDPEKSMETVFRPQPRRSTLADLPSFSTTSKLDPRRHVSTKTKPETSTPHSRSSSFSWHKPTTWFSRNNSNDAHSSTTAENPLSRSHNFLSMSSSRNHKKEPGELDAFLPGET